MKRKRNGAGGARGSHAFPPSPRPVRVAKKRRRGPGRPLCIPATPEAAEAEELRAKLGWPLEKFANVAFLMDRANYRRFRAGQARPHHLELLLERTRKLAKEGEHGRGRAAREG